MKLEHDEILVRIDSDRVLNSETWAAINIVCLNQSPNRSVELAAPACRLIVERVVGTASLMLCSPVPFRLVNQQGRESLTQECTLSTRSHRRFYLIYFKVYSDRQTDMGQNKILMLRFPARN